MKIRIFLILLIFTNCSCAQSGEKEFDYADTYEEGTFEKINSAKDYKILVNRKYQDFSNAKEDLNELKGFHFRADEIKKIEESSVSIYGTKYPAKNFQINVKTKIIGTQGIATVTYTNRNLRLRMSLINDNESILKDSILNRIRITSEDNKDKDYYAPWVIQLNDRGVFKNCENHVLWDYYYTEKETFILYWVDNKCLKIGIAPESERYDDEEFQIWNKEKKSTKEEYLKSIRQLDYKGLFNYTQGCSYFIGGNEGGIKWKEKDCEILFECESNIESKEILETFK
jgi:hypothetical protein